MKNFLLVLLSLYCINVHAGINKWVDEQGRVHYSDQPPPSVVKSKKLGSTAKENNPSETGDTTEPGNAAESGNSDEPKTIAEREADLRKKQKADKEAAEKAAKEKASKEANKDSCDRAQLNLKALQGEMRIMDLNAQGEQVYLDDEQRKQRIAKVQEEISKNCK